MIITIKIEIVMGLLKGEENVLFEGDYVTIKEKIFKRCNGQGIRTIELIDVYTLVAQLDIAFEDIDWLIASDLCVEIPRAIKGTPHCSFKSMPKISDLQVCKEFMNDKELFCKNHCEGLAYYDYNKDIRQYIDRLMMCCYVSLSPELELAYNEYTKEHKTLNGSAIDFEYPWRLGAQGTTPLSKSNLDWKGIDSIVWSGSRSDGVCYGGLSNEYLASGGTDANC